MNHKSFLTEACAIPRKMIELRDHRLIAPQSELPSSAAWASVRASFDDLALSAAATPAVHFAGSSIARKSFTSISNCAASCRMSVSLEPEADVRTVEIFWSMMLRRCSTRSSFLLAVSLI
jgi:hypothetical protein